MHRSLTLLAMAAFLFREAEASSLPADFLDLTVASGITLATGLALIPDGRILVLSKAGNVNLVAGSNSTVIHTVPNVLTTQEAGLVGVAVDPGWPSRPFVYLFYNRDPLEKLVLERYTASGDLMSPFSTSLSLSDSFEILSIPESSWNHNGGTLRFGPDDMLYCTVGEDFQFCVAQDSSSISGVALRMNVSTLPDTGSGPADRNLLIPADNPYASDSTDAALVFCHGLRNPYRFNIDPMAGSLYIGDVGANDYEELDESMGGENFGWPVWEADSLFGVNFGIDCGPHSPLTFPIASYFHTPSAGGGALPYAIVAGPAYRGTGGFFDFPPEYEGIVFYADFYRGWIRAIRKVGQNWIPLDPVPGQPDSTYWATGFGNITDMIQAPDGSIYYTVYNPGRVGRILFSGVTGSSTASRPSSRVVASPNPFLAGSGEIRFEIPSRARNGQFDVYDVRGGLVRRLSPGSDGGVTWDGRNESGILVPTGTYYVHALGRGYSETTKVTIVH